MTATLLLILSPFLFAYINQNLIPYFEHFKLKSPNGIPPVASFTYSPMIPTPGEMVSFDASRSYDLDGSIESYGWNFGDGNLTVANDPIIKHSYTIDGNYTVELTIRDNSGLENTATCVVQVNTEVFFRVVIYGTLIPLPYANVTVYYQNESTWVIAPTGPHGVEVKYDLTTQPDMANTDADKYRNPGTTATVLCHDASNIGFDIRPASTWKIFFKFQWGPYVAYWPNQTARVYNYRDGEILSNNYLSGHEAYWDPTASTYVIKANDIPGHGVAPTSYHPIIVGIMAPSQPTEYYLTVRTDPSDVTAIPGQGWHANGTDVVLTAPEIVSAWSGSRYSFAYWDLDGAMAESGADSITVTMNMNHTATAHYRLQYAVAFGVSGLSDATGTVVIVDGESKTVVDLPFTKWVTDGNSVAYSYTALIDSGTLGKRFRLNSASGPASPIVVTNPVVVTGNYVTQFSVMFAQTGLDETAVGTVVTINGIAKIYSELPNATWADAGSSVTYSYGDIVLSSISGKRFKLVSINCPSSPFVVTESMAITGNYKIQYLVTFDQTGVGSDFTGTVATVDGVNFSASLLPNSTWLDKGSSHLFAFASPLAIDGKEYIWSSASGLSTLQSGNLVITGSGSIVGDYTVQGQVTFLITFNQIGVGPDFPGAVVVIDGVSYYCSNLPASFLWNDGSIHSFAFQSPLLVSFDSKRYIWNDTSGLSDVQSGPIIVGANGSVVGSYKTQYYLAITSAYDSPSPVSGWFDSESSVNAYVTSPALGPNGRQYVCTGWMGTASVPASGTVSSVSFTITSPSSIIWTWAWKIQYYLTVRTNPSSIVTIPGEGWYNISTIVPLSAPPVSGYNFQYWDVDGNVQGTNVTSIAVTMNAPHTATAHYLKSGTVPVGGRSILIIKSTSTSLMPIYVVLVTMISAAFVLTKRKRR